MNTKTKAIIAYLIVLLAGFAAGYVVHYLQEPPSYNQWNQNGEQGRWDHERGGMGREMGGGMYPNERLARTLSLDADQRDPFFNKIRQFHRGVRDEIRSRRENEKEIILERYNEFREEVSEILSEEQLMKLDQVAHPDSVESRRNRNMRGPRR
jgi:hypothetical protein